MMKESHIEKGLEGGLFHIVLATPELFMVVHVTDGDLYIFTSAIYRKRLRLSSINEVHCIRYKMICLKYLS